MKGNCPDCKKEIDIVASTENITFFIQNCRHCGNDHTAVVRNFKLKDGKVYGELVNTAITGHLDIGRDRDGEEKGE